MYAEKKNMLFIAHNTDVLPGVKYLDIPFISPAMLSAVPLS